MFRFCGKKSTFKTTVAAMTRINYLSRSSSIFVAFFICFFLFADIFGYSQTTNPCDSTTPVFTIDLTGNPGGFYNIAPLSRVGLCCNATSPNKCIVAFITLDSNSAGLKFEISSGSVPSGALYYQIGCDTPKVVGEFICLNGPGPHVLTFCKPGNNQNGYRISAIPKSVIPDSLNVALGCSIDIGTVGYFVDTSLHWRDITSTDGRYDSFLNCLTGCDTVTFTPDSSAPAYIDYEVCGNLKDTICSNNGTSLCKTIRVNIIRITDTIYTVICSNEVFTLPDGSIPTSSGVYRDTLTSVMGCDSFLTNYLTINSTKETFFFQTDCDSITYLGITYYTSQTITDSFTTSLGCDSIVITALTINNAVTTNLATTSCDSASVNDDWYYTSQTVTYNFTTSLGCDSIVLTALTINNAVTTNLATTSCDSSSVNDDWYYTSQTVTYSFTTSLGCDSIVVTALTINNAVTTNVATISCDSSSVNGTWYYTSQTVTDSFMTSLGCDSIVLTALTINNAANTNVLTTSCDSSSVNGNWYYISQTVTDSFTTSLGCDSIVLTALTINNAATTNVLTTSCDSSSVNGNWYFASQTVTDSFIT
ncbi:MAG: hypothetical protein ACI9BJ_000418, partial [Flavobacteriales bacterium]